MFVARGIKQKLWRIFFWTPCIISNTFNTSHDYRLCKVIDFKCEFIVYKSTIIEPRPICSLGGGRLFVSRLLKDCLLSSQLYDKTGGETLGSKIFLFLQKISQILTEIVFNGQKCCVNYKNIY